MLKAKTVKESLREWLNRCVCENIDHPLEDARQKRTYLFLRPAINDDLKPDLKWLQENMSKFFNPEDLIRHIEATLIMKRHKYDYQPHAPFICNECAENIGLEIYEEWGITTQTFSKCFNCGLKWDPFDDKIPGAHCVVDGENYCIVCFLRQGLQSDQLSNKETAKKLTKVQSEMKDRKTATEVKREQKRELNNLIYEDWLAANSCLECGEVELSKLIAIPGRNSPPGKVYLWKRDNSSETFKKKIKTTNVFCKACISANTSQLLRQ